jgi:ABC-type lipoprotein export system ATPase subunit
MVPVIAAGGKRAEGLARLNDLAAATGVAHRLGQRVRELSGGERQRGALVRALMNDPEILLCDEPTGALDETNREKVFELLLELVRSRGRTLVLATHDSELARRCDRHVRMRDGRIEGESI